MNYHRTIRFSALVLAGTMLGGIQAHAQDAAEDAGDSGYSEVASENEIIVTAQRREERLQEVPLAISAFDQAAMENSKVETLADFSAKVPNVSLQPVGAFQFASAFSIRGLGFADVESSAEPAVGVEVDGVYLARNVGALLDLFDIEGVQVLRGPQGTLYGRNTIGGVVSVRSARPDDEFGGKFQGTIGSFGRREARAMVKTPLNDSLGFKVAGLYKDYDGYIDNADGRSLPKERTRSVRGTLTFESGDFDSALIADYTKLKGDGPGFENASLPTMVLPIRGYPADQDGEPYTTYATDSNALMLETWGVTLEMNASLPIGTFTSSSGYRKTIPSPDSEFAGEPVRVRQVDRREDHCEFSQELRLAGDVG
ncbi:MAG: TonB-dependent receptor, partial [Sphingomonadaceae bacterium]